MSLATVDRLIDAKRASAVALVDTYNREISLIESDTNLSLEGRRVALAGLHLRIKERLSDLRREEEEAAGSEIKRLEQSVFGANEMDPASVVSYRDAQDRASQITDERAALELLRTATLSRDRVLASAVASKALGESWSNVIDQYTVDYPSQGNALKDYVTLSNWSKSEELNFMGGRSAIYRAPLPKDLQGLPENQIKDLAEQGESSRTFFGV